MIHSDLKKFYSLFLKGHEGKLHFAAHSHHFWPDVTREAQLEYWDDTSRTSDEKWDKIFGIVIPNAQKHIARILNLKDPQQIAFAPNTHELATRLLSLFIGRGSLKILTTSNEFHSWKRQILRLSEIPQVEIKQVDTDNFLNDRKNIIQNLKTELAQKPDVFFMSQVFFDSGMAFTEEEILELSSAVQNPTIMVVDGYHGFGAIPLDLSKLEGRIFYLAGGYKYAQAGEGAAFMVIPKGDWRPVQTGWFAEYAELSKPKGALVGYSQDFMAFMGATQDPSGLYRLNATWDLFLKEGLSIKSIHSFVAQLEAHFLQEFAPELAQKMGLKPLFDPGLGHHGHFLTYEAQTLELAESIQSRLKEAGALIDRRGKRLRFGFGLYQDEADVKELASRLKKLAK